MRIVKCCASVKLQGGERKWRHMARLVSYDGLVRVRGFRASDDQKVAGHNRVTVGSMSRENRVITIRVSHGCGRAEFDNPRTYSPLSTFGHELGHFILGQRGKRDWTRARPFHDNAEQRSDPVERACDRYSRILRAK